MTKRAIGLTLLGLLSYAVFLVATIPAARAWAWVGDGVPLQAYGLDGTIWKGRAAVLQDPVRRIEAVQWDLKALQLLLGRLAVDAQGRLPDNGRFQGDFRLALAGSSLRGSDVRVDLPAPVLLQWLQLPVPVNVDGHFDMSMQSFMLDAGRLTDADGILNWNNASVRLGSQHLPLGNVALRLTPGEDVINGELLNQGSPLQLNGNLQLTPEGRFVLDISAALAEDADEESRKTYSMLGVPADGSPVQARLSGALDGSGFRMEPLNQ